MAPTITIIGNVASGKSTLIGILSKALGARAVDADNLFQVRDPFARPFLADKSRWALANELWLTHERIKIMRKARRSGRSPLTLIDSGLLMSWVFTHSHYLVGIITPDEWKLYRSFYEELTEGLFTDTNVIRLKYSMDTLMKRLNKRARNFELEFYTREYLGQIEMGLDALEKRLKTKKINVISITEEMIADFEQNPHEAEKVIALVRNVAYGK